MFSCTSKVKPDRITNPRKTRAKWRFGVEIIVTSDLRTYLQRKSAQIFALILPLPIVDILLGIDILRQFGDLKVHYGKLNEKHDERTITIPPQQETHIMLQQDVSIPAYFIDAVSTKPNINVNLYGKAWVVEPSAMLLSKRALVWDIP